MILRGGLLKADPGGGPERWSDIMDVKYEIYMILTYGLLKADPAGGPERWCQIMDVKYI